MDTFIGTICVFGFNFAPRNWAFCNGQLVAIQSNTALFSLLGTTYGGNGTTTFALPNLQGRAAVCQGQLLGGSNYIMGEMGGNDNVTVLISNMPAHAHNVGIVVNANARAQSTNSPSGAFPAPSEKNQNNYSTTSTTGVLMKGISTTLGASGGSTPIPISDPSLVMNYCICQYGIFPSRN
jgi:microcystin-dependent protein